MIQYVEDCWQQLINIFIAETFLHCLESMMWKIIELRSSLSPHYTLVFQTKANIHVFCVLHRRKIDKSDKSNVIQMTQIEQIEIISKLSPEKTDLKLTQIENDLHQSRKHFSLKLFCFARKAYPIKNQPMPKSTELKMNRHETRPELILKLSRPESNGINPFIRSRNRGSHKLVTYLRTIIINAFTFVALVPKHATKALKIWLLTCCFVEWKGLMSDQLCWIQ